MCVCVCEREREREREREVHLTLGDSNTLDSQEPKCELVSREEDIKMTQERASRRG